jgi:hypothetical protein
MAIDRIRWHEEAALRWGVLVGMASYGTIDASIWQVKVACRDDCQAEESVRHGIGMATIRSMATERGTGNID